MPTAKKTKGKKKRETAKKDSPSTVRVSDELDPRKACKLVPPSRQTNFVRDFSRAADLLEEGRDSAVLSPFSGDNNAGGQGFVLAYTCPHVLHGCACFIQALLLLTDCRIAVEMQKLMAVPRYFNLSQITFDVKVLGHTNLMNIGVGGFLMLMVDAIKLRLTSRISFARRVVHELEAHLKENAIDFSELESNPDLYCGMTKADVVFSLAVLGIKVNRHLFRLPPNHREESPELFETPTTATLLSDCRRFAEMQNQANPESPTASMNLAWVEFESKNLKEATRWFSESVDRADAIEDDIIKCTSRIELAGCMILGSGTGEPKVQRGVIQELYDGFKDGCRRLEEWHMDSQARGESSMDGFVKDYLRQYRTADRHGLTPTRDPTPIMGPSVRDLGPQEALTYKCDACGGQFMTVRACGGCKKVSYCGRQCQVAHWKAGHKKECKKKDSGDTSNT